MTVCFFKGEGVGIVKKIVFCTYGWLMNYFIVSIFMTVVSG